MGVAWPTIFIFDCQQQTAEAQDNGDTDHIQPIKIQFQKMVLKLFFKVEQLHKVALTYSKFVCVIFKYGVGHDFKALDFKNTFFKIKKVEF